MNPLALFMLGQVLLETEKQSLAYPIYKLLTQLEPKRPEIWINMGKAAGELHRYDEEEKFFKKALKFANEQGNESVIFLATRNLATNAVHQTNPDKALYWGKRALEIKENKTYNEKVQEKYEENSEGMRKVRRRINDAIDYAREELRTNERLRKTFEEYTEMCEGKQEMAFKFLVKANNYIDPEDLAGIVGINYIPEDQPEKLNDTGQDSL